MDRQSYYEYLKALARDVRSRFQLTSETVSLSALRAIYHQEGINIDYWDYTLKKVRGAYFLIDGEANVLVNGSIKPAETRIFILAHELKHHYIDQEVAENQLIGCQTDWSQLSPIEIGAEIFAAELIYPEPEFLELANTMGMVGKECIPQDVVYLKQRCPAPVNYIFLVKRFERFGLVAKDAFKGVQFQKLQESMLGVPFYKKRNQLSRSKYPSHRTGARQ